MGSKPKNVLNLEKRVEVLPSPSQDPVERESRGMAPSTGSGTGADKVEALVGNYLTELDVLSSELKPAKLSGPRRATVTVRVPSRLGSKVIEPLLTRIEEKAAPEKIKDDIADDVDAELARALDELEEQERRNVVTLPIHEVPSSVPEGMPFVSYLESSSPAPVASPPTSGVLESGSPRQSSAGEAEPELSPRLGPTLITFTEPAKPLDRRWGAAIGFAAVILLGVAALAVYSLLPSMPGMKSSPRSGAQPSLSTPSAIGPDSPQGADKSKLRKGRSGAAPGSKQPTAMPRRNPAKAPPDQPKKEGFENDPSVDHTMAGQSSARNPQEPSMPPAASSQSARGTPARAEPDPAEMPQASASTALRANSQPNSSQSEPIPPASVRQPASDDAPRSPPAAQDVTPANLQNQTIASKPAPAPAEQPASAYISPVAAGPGMNSKETVDPSRSVTPPETSFSPPVAISKAVPKYPPVAKNFHTSGTVVLAARIDEQGRVLKATAVSGPGLLRPTAEEALRKWRFKPAVRDGVNVSSEVRISIIFR
jgi:protein TonB